MTDSRSAIHTNATLSASSPTHRHGDPRPPGGVALSPRRKIGAFVAATLLVMVWSGARAAAPSVEYTAVIKVYWDIILGTITITSGSFHESCAAAADKIKSKVGTTTTCIDAYGIPRTCRINITATRVDAFTWELRNSAGQVIDGGDASSRGTTPNTVIAASRS